MRYLVTFFDSSSKRINEEEAKALSQAILRGDNGYFIAGAFVAKGQVTSIKPIDRRWMSGQEVEGNLKEAEREERAALKIQNNPLLPGQPKKLA